MQSFTYFTFWYSPVVITAFFFFFFIRSILCLGDFTTFNPLFEKKRIKYAQQMTSFVNRFTPVVMSYYSVLSFVHFDNIKDFYSTGIYTLYCLPLFFVILYVFLRIGELYFYKFTGSLSQNTASINTAGLFIVAFIPVATAMFCADSLIQLILPLELLGFLFYFIFLEFNYTNYTKSKLPRNRNSVVMRGLIYYFWLSFIGSIFFIISILVNLLILPSTELHLAYFNTFDSILPIALVFSSSFIFIGFSLKLGGFFFFFFKSDLYKLLPAHGVILFSVYTSFFYLSLLFFLSAKFFFFAFCFRMLVSGVVFTLTVYSLLFGNLTQRNVLLLAGFSTVLTICFCILIVL